MFFLSLKLQFIKANHAKISFNLEKVLINLCLYILFKKYVNKYYIIKFIIHIALETHAIRWWLIVNKYNTKNDMVKARPKVKIDKVMTAKGLQILNMPILWWRKGERGRAIKKPAPLPKRKWLRTFCAMFPQRTASWCSFPQHESCSFSSGWDAIISFYDCF